MKHDKTDIFDDNGALIFGYKDVVLSEYNSKELLEAFDAALNSHGLELVMFETSGTFYAMRVERIPGFRPLKSA